MTNRSAVDGGPCVTDHPVMTAYRLTPHERVSVTERTPDALTATATYAPGGSPPPAHLHPFQDEDFEVLSGCLTVRLGRDERVLSPGERIGIPRGTSHSMFNGADVPARVRWTTSPPGRTEEWWATLDKIDEPGLRTMAGPLRDYADVFRLAAPAWLVNPVLAGVSMFTRAGTR